MALILNGDTGITYPVATATGSATQASAGRVLQVVFATTSTDTTITSTSFTDTTLSASITPSSSTSKILVLVTQSYLLYREAASVSAGMQIVRGSTSIIASQFTPALNAALNGTSAFVRGTWAMNYLDSPATTSSTTYKTQASISTSANSGQIRLQQNGSEISSITLMEIAA